MHNWLFWVKRTTKKIWCMNIFNIDRRKIKFFNFLVQKSHNLKLILIYSPAEFLWTFWIIKFPLFIKNPLFASALIISFWIEKEDKVIQIEIIFSYIMFPNNFASFRVRIHFTGKINIISLFYLVLGQVWSQLQPQLGRVWNLTRAVKLLNMTLNTVMLCNTQTTTSHYHNTFIFNLWTKLIVLKIWIILYLDKQGLYLVWMTRIKTIVGNGSCCLLSVLSKYLDKW